MGTSGNDTLFGVTGGGSGAVAQVNDVTFTNPTAATNVGSYTFNGQIATFLTGTASTDTATNFIASINALAGRTVAAIGGTTSIVTVTAPTAGTPFSLSFTVQNTNAGVATGVVPAVALTTANVVGTVGTGTTLNIFDTIALGDGIDVMNLNIGGVATALTATNTPTLGGVEVLNISNQGGAFAFAGALAPSLTTLSNAGSAVAASTTTVTAARATMTTLNLTSLTGTGQDQTITYTTAALAGASDVATINLNGVRASAANNTAANAVNVILNGPDAGLTSGFETVVINATGTGENRLEAVTVQNSTPIGTMTALNLNNNSTGTLRIWNDLVFKAATPGGAIGAGTVTATGTSGVDISSGLNQNLTFTGGAGNDTVRISAALALTSADSINLGTGTNTLFLADTVLDTTTTVAYNALINAITTAQNIGFSAATTGTGINLNVVTANNIYVGLAGAGGTYTFTNVAAADSINALGVTVGAMTLTASVGFNTLNLNAIATAEAAAGFAAVAATGQSTINIGSTSTGTQAAVNTIAAMTVDANTIVNVTGTQDLTITSFSHGVVVNGGTFTGILTATGLAGGGAASMTGGSGNDVLTGSTLVGDTIVGGAGNDTLSTGVDALAGGATMTGGLGADSIILASTTAVAHTTALNATAAESFATAGQFDTVTFGDLVGGSNVVTVTTGVLSSTVTAATAVVVGTTVVAAGSFLVVNAAGILTANNQNFILYQDSNSSGIIDATDLQINFTVTATDTFAVSTVGGKAVITDTGV